MPRGNKILIRTGTTTPQAADFATSEPAWNSSAGKLYIKGSSGMVEIGTSSVYVYETVSAFPATGAANTLYVDSSTSRIWRWESPIYVETGPVGGGGGGGSSVDTNTIFHPFLLGGM
jgi:hypothetical protein